MTTFVALREPAVWSFAPEHTDMIAYLEAKWHAHLPSDRDVVGFHRDRKLTLRPVVKIIQTVEADDGRIEITATAGCEFAKKADAMLFKLTWGGA